MKKVTLSLAVMASAAFMVACGGAEQPTAEETQTVEEQAEVEEAPAQEMASGAINLEESKLMWKGEMLGIKDHTGTLAFKSGEIQAENGQITGGSFVVDMTSMVATDENYQPEEGYTKEKLIGHLSSPDFFNVEEFPETMFEITGSTDGEVTGNLTIRGITNEVKVSNVAFDAESGTYKGTLTFNRKNFDVSWDSTMKDAVLSDDIELTIYLKV